MNRAPGPNDNWWQQHQSTCGGTYTKIREPEGYGKKKGSGKENKKASHIFKCRFMRIIVLFAIISKIKSLSEGLLRKPEDVKFKVVEIVTFVMS